jgi:hypothetical protein
MTSISPLIGICGRMGAGKDTLAALIAARHPAHQQWKFADALRTAASIVTDIPAHKLLSAEEKAVDLSGTSYGTHQLWVRLANAINVTIPGTSYEKKSYGQLADQMFELLTGTTFERAGTTVTLPMTAGRLLQLLGTEGFRQCVGPEIWVEALFARWTAGQRPPIIVADVRFPNEADAIRRHGGVVLLVRRADANRSDGRSTEHESERALDAIRPDIIIDNDGTLEELRALAEDLWSSLAALKEFKAMADTVTMTLRASTFPLATSEMVVPAGGQRRPGGDSAAGPQRGAAAGPQRGAAAGPQ